MYVTNLTDRPVGIDGILVLKPYEENRYINDTGDLYIRVGKLCAAKLVSVSKQPGLVKEVPAEAVEEVIVETKPAAEPVVEPVIEPEPVAEPVVEAKPTKSRTTKRGAKNDVQAE